MRFSYTYRSSDGQRHSAEIEAESRDAVFAKVRTELGIRPIKVTLASEELRGKGEELGVGRRLGWKVKVLGALGFLGILVALGAFAWGRRGGDEAPYQVMTPQGPVTYTVATPLPRQAIPGDRQRIEEAIAGGEVFRHAAERWLARYAEPGRRGKREELRGKREALRGKREELESGELESGELMGKRGESLGMGDVEAALREPIRVASTDFTEVVDLKRIVAGMKREMKAYLVGGGTVREYCAELEKRQKLEISYRERAEQRLREQLLSAEKGGASLRPAYGYWLKANASLKSMGIGELPLPDELRSYQMGLGIEE